MVFDLDTQGPGRPNPLMSNSSVIPEVMKLVRSHKSFTNKGVDHK